MEKPVAVKFVVKNNIYIFSIRLARYFCSEIQSYKMTRTFVDPEVKLITRAIVKL